MRTTIEFDDDTARALAQLRRDSGMGVSAAVNHLVRQGLLVEAEQPAFVQQTHPLGLLVDVSNISDAIDLLEGPQAR